MGAKEAKNTLRSRSVARVIDLLNEGETEVIGGRQGVYLEKTQLETANGRNNFQGVRAAFRTGTKDQTYIPGLRSAENELNIGVQIKKATPVTRAIVDTSLDAVSVKVRVSALTFTDKKSGDIKGSKVQLSIYRQNFGGAYVKVATMKINGKTTSAYERATRVALPVGTGPWNIKVERDTNDSDNSYLRNDTYLSSITLINDEKLTYPYSALCGIEVDAQKFGSSFPERRYRKRRVNAPYPSNWNPTTRVYTGVWDGTFLYGTHDNPAWYLYELTTNNRFGLGDIITSTGIDKWMLYTIAQYSDGMVPDGKGGLEPRFTFNGEVTSRQAGIKLLDAIASVFRGMIYWSAGGVAFAQDAPGTAAIQVTNANTLDGTFNRVSSANKARHTSVLVGWNNPKLLGDIDYVPVDRDDLIQRFGRRPKEVSAFGCTSEGQARRTGEWILDSEANETEVITWKASLDQIEAFPGTLVAIYDPAHQGARFGGRIMANTGNSVITLDAPVTVGAGTFNLNVMLPDGTIESRVITGWSGGNTIVTLASPLSQTPVEAAIWTIDGTSLAPELARITGMFEKAPNVFEIQALKHDPTKYDRVERDRQIPTPPTTVVPIGKLAAPTELDLSEYFVDINGANEPALLISWQMPDDPRVMSLEYQWTEDDGEYGDVVRINTTSVDLTSVPEGWFTFQIRSTAQFAASSDWLTKRVYVVGANKKPGDVAGLRCNVTGGEAVLRWTKNDDAITRSYEVRFDPAASPTWEGATVVASNISKNTDHISTVARVGTYLIKAVTKNGVYSATAGSVLNAIGIAPGTLGGVIDESADWFGLQEQTILRSNVNGNFAASPWALSGLTTPALLRLRETATTAEHKASATLVMVHPKDHIDFLSRILSTLGSRNYRIRISDNAGNFATADINLTTFTTITSSSSGFTGVSFVTTNPAAGQTQTVISFDTLEETEQLTIEYFILSGTSDNYLGVVTNGVNFHSQSMNITNETLIENGSGFLELAPDGSGYRTNAYYEFANSAFSSYLDPSLSLTKKTNVKFRTQVEYTVPAGNLVLNDWSILNDIEYLDGNTDGISIVWQMRVSDVLAVTDADYGEWMDLTDAVYTLQYAQFRFLITSTNPAITPIITSAVVNWEILGYQEGQEGIVSGIGNYDVVFTQEFYQLPAIHVLPLTSAANIIISNKTTTGFRVRFENSGGSAIGRVFDWTATGFGPVIP